MSNSVLKHIGAKWFDGETLGSQSVTAFLLTACLTLGAVPETFSQTNAQQPAWTLNFKDSDIQEVIKFIADVTGKTIVIDPRVKGRVKVISKEPLNEREMFDLFRTVLELHDFTAIEVNNVIRVIPLKDARNSPLPVVKRPAADEGYVTEVIQLKNIAAVKVLPVLRPLVPQHSHLAAYDPSNAIVVSDTAANIIRLREVIDRIDTAALPETEVVPLKYAESEEMVATLQKLERSSKNTSAPSNQLQMVADKRNNAVILSGEDLQRVRMKQLIKRLDKPQSHSGNVRVIYLEYADAKKVAEALTKIVQNMAKLTPGGDSKSQQRSATVEADEDTNALLITASGDVLNSLLTVVERLDIRRAQILVEAIIVELTVTDNDQIGLDWLFTDGSQGTFGGSNNGGGGVASIGSGLLGGGSSTGTDGSSSLSDAALGIAQSLAGLSGQTFGIAGSIGDSDDGTSGNFLAVLRALEDNNKANILSTPSLMTMDNHEATITVGQNVPFVTGSFSNSGGGTAVNNPFTTIQREDVGITLTVTPQVNEGDKVLLDIVQEVSGLTGESSNNAADVITNQRKIETRIMAEDGQTVVLGGLLQEETDGTDRRVPFLGHIPIIGNLFKSKTSKYGKTNLMVFLRAKIIRDEKTMNDATAEKYRFIREQQQKVREEGFYRIRKNDIPVLPALTAEDLGVTIERIQDTANDDSNTETPSSSVE